MSEMAVQKLISLFIIVNTVATVMGHKDINIQDIRLGGSPTEFPNAGRVEVLENNNWRQVCHDGGRSDHDWSIEEAMVTCRQLGYPGTAMTSKGDFRRGQLERSIEAIECDGDEETLNDCDEHEKEDRCDVGDEAGVICTVPGYLGCFQDDPSNRTLPDEHWKDGAMNIKKCKEFCSRQTPTMQYAGLQGHHCFCGVSGTDYDRLGCTWDRECDVACAGSQYDICGGNNRMSIYDLHQGTCTDPSPKNGFTNEQDFSFGNWVTFGCNPGYHLVGSDRLQCVLGDNPSNSTWSENLPLCEIKSTLIPVPNPTHSTTRKPNTISSKTTTRKLTTRPVTMIIPPNESHTQASIGLITGLVAACGLVLLVAVVFLYIRPRKVRSGNTGPTGQPLAFDGPYDLTIENSSNQPPPYSEQPIYTIQTCPPYEASATAGTCALSRCEPPPDYSEVAGTNGTINGGK